MNFYDQLFVPDEIVDRCKAVHFSSKVVCVIRSSAVGQLLFALLSVSWSLVSLPRSPD